LAAAGEQLRVVIETCSWVNGLWQHCGDGSADLEDPLGIIEHARAGGQFRCAEYSAVLAGCLNALGIPARLLALKKRTVETDESLAGHVGAEAYLAKLCRWVFLDPQFDFVACRDDSPLDAAGLGAALGERDEVSNAGKDVGELGGYLGWLGPYLYYLDTRLDNRIGASDRSLHSIMLVPAGAPKPTVMQRRWPIEHMTYIDDRDDFYPTPSPLPT
jgi:hypothetical protein